MLLFHHLKTRETARIKFALKKSLAWLIQVCHGNALIGKSIWTWWPYKKVLIDLSANAAGITLRKGTIHIWHQFPSSINPSLFTCNDEQQLL